MSQDRRTFLLSLSSIAVLPASDRPGTSISDIHPRPAQTDPRQTPHVINALTYLKGDGSVEYPARVRALTAAIARACASGGRVSVRANGVFRLICDPTGPSAYGERYCVNLSGCNNAYFDCAGATWLIDGQDNHGKYANGLVLENSVGVTGDIGTIDWAKLPFAQGKVASKTGTSVIIDLDPGHTPTWREAQRIELYDRATRENLNNILTKRFSGPAGADAKGWSVSYLEPSRMVVDFTGDRAGLAFLASMKVGDLYVVTYRIYGGDALRITGCTRAQLKIRVAAAAGMATRLLDCSDTKIISEVHSTGSRLISTTADGVHARSMRGYLDLNAMISGTGDDAVNLETDSYDVSAILVPRTAKLAPSYPYLLPRIGDKLTAVSAAGVVTPMGNVVTVDVNTGFVTMSENLPKGLATTSQVINPSATPRHTIIDVRTGPCRGNVILQIPRVTGTIDANGLHGCVELAYIPSFTSEGAIPSYAKLKISAHRCALLMSSPGAVVVQSTLPGGSGYAPPGTIVDANIDVYVDDTRNSGLFVSSATNATIRLVTSRCCANPDTKTYAGADAQLAMINCARPTLVSALNQGPATGTIFKRNVAGLTMGRLQNFRA